MNEQETKTNRQLIMKVRKKDFYLGTTEDLIEFFEEKYPLKPNNTMPRKEGEYYCIHANLGEDEKTIRNQIENSKYASSAFFYMRVTQEPGEELQTLHIEMQWFNRTDFNTK